MSKTMQREAEMSKICSGTGADAPQPGAILQDCPTCHTAQITDSDGSATWFVPHQAAVEETAKVAAKKNMVWKCDSTELANALGSTVKDLVGENTVQVDGTMVVFYDEIGINTETRLKLDSLSGGVLQVNAAATRSKEWRKGYNQGLWDKQKGTGNNGFSIEDPEEKKGYAAGYRDGKTSSLDKEAHDSGDGETIFHCPFCGSGQVIGRSDGTAICDFCTTAFTVQVQPERSSQPQTINGVPAQMPGMPHGGDNASNPVQQAAPNEEGGIADTNPFDSDKQKPEEQKPVEEEKPKPKGNQPPWLKNSSVNYYLTSEGVALNEDAYIRHLAIKFAGEERMSVIASVRDENERKMNDGDH